MNKKIQALLCASALCFSLAAPVLADEPIKVQIYGEPIEWTDAVPFIDENNRTLVPLRAVGEAMGLSVSWNDDSREAMFSGQNKCIWFGQNNSEARYEISGALDSGVIEMDTAAVIVNERIYAPVRYLAEFFGYRVDWNQAARTVLISFQPDSLDDVTAAEEQARARQEHIDSLTPEERAAEKNREIAKVLAFLIGLQITQQEGSGVEFADFDLLVDDLTAGEDQAITDDA